MGELRTAIAREYGAYPDRLVAITEHEDKAVYRVGHAGPDWLMRWFPVSRPQERVDGDAEVLRTLLHLPVERLVQTVDGRGFAVIGGRGVIMTEFLVGAPATSSPSVLQTVAAALGDVATTTVDRGSMVARRAGSLPAEDLAAARRWLDDIAGQVPPELGPVFGRLRADVAGASDCEAAPTGLVHPDCHLGNIRISGGRPVLFDWDGAGVGPLVAALGWLLFSSAVAGPDRPVGPFDPAAASAVIAGYTSRRDLTAQELCLLSDAARFRPLTIACRQLRHAIQAKDNTAASGWWSRYPEADDVTAFVLGT